MPNNNEEKEFEELALLEEFEAQDQVNIEQGEAQVDVDAPTENNISQENAQGIISKLPFGEEGMASIVTGVQALEEVIDKGVKESVDNLSVNYNNNLRQLESEIQDTRDSGSEAFHRGEIEGQFAPAFLPGGASLIGSSLIGGVVSLDEAEDKGIDDFIGGLATGAAFHTGGAIVAKGVAKTGSLIGGKLIDSSKKLLTSATGAFKSPTTRKKLTKWLDMSGQTVDKFADSLSSITVNKVNSKGKKISQPLFKIGQSPISTKENLQIARQTLGKQIGDTYSKLDDKLGDASAMKSSLLSLKLKNRVTRDLHTNKSTSELAKTIDTIIDNATEPFTRVPKQVLTKDGAVQTIVESIPNPNRKIGLSEMHEVQMSMRKEISNFYSGTKSVNETAKAYHQANVATEVGNVMDDVIGKLDPAELGNLQGLRKQFGNVAKADEFITDLVHATDDSFVGQLKSTFAGLRGQVAGAAAFAVTDSIAIAAATTAVLNKVASSPRTPVTLGIGFNKLGNYLQKNPASPMIKRIALASSLTAVEFREKVSSMVAEVGFRDKPLPRDTGSALDKKEEVLAILDDRNPQAAEAFRDALDKEDSNSIATIMDAASKDPKINQLFEEGIGFDGKVHSEEDKSMFDSQIRGNDQIGAAQRIQLLEQLHQNGIIPDLNSVQPREPKKYKSGGKSKY